ncbi:MAG: hypothetical protein ABGF52_13730, partial [Candidatus Asgardarchaeum sp.]
PLGGERAILSEAMCSIFIKILSQGKYLVEKRLVKGRPTVRFQKLEDGKIELFSFLLMRNWARAYFSLFSTEVS